MVVYAEIDKKKYGDLEVRFRMKVVERFGTQKGAMNKAVVEAIKLWLKS